MTDTQTPTNAPTDPLDLLTEDDPVKHSRIDTAFYEKALTRSKTTGKALSYPLSAKSGDAKKEESALRQVANSLGFGLKVQVVDAELATARIKFQVAKKREFTEESKASRKAKMQATRAATKAKKEAEAALKKEAEAFEKADENRVEHEKAKVQVRRR